MKTGADQQQNSATVDNQSTTSNSSQDFHQEHTFSSDDFLKIESKGCTGCLERWPLWSKLLLLTTLAFLIIIQFAAALTYVKGM